MKLIEKKNVNALLLSLYVLAVSVRVSSHLAHETISVFISTMPVKGHSANNID